MTLGGVPAEEGVSTADAVERLERGPEEQENREEGRPDHGPELGVDEVPETDPAQETSTTSPPPEEPTGTSQWPAP